MSNIRISLLSETQKNDEQSLPACSSGRLQPSIWSLPTLNYPQNRYRELLRVSRQWRNLKEWKWFGFGHRKETPGPAEMALFCPTCPQPGINLPETWQDDPREWLYWRSLVVDGNFVAIHQFQQRSVDDVWVKNGESFMTEREKYQQHLDCTTEKREVSTELDTAPSDNKHFPSPVPAINTVLCLTNQNVIKVVMSLGLVQ